MQLQPNSQHAAWGRSQISAPGLFVATASSNWVKNWSTQPVQPGMLPDVQPHMLQPGHARWRCATLPWCWHLPHGYASTHTSVDRQHTPHLAAPQVAAVVVGFDRNINYYKIQYATLCIRENPGCMFIATNLGAWLVTWRSLVTPRFVDVVPCTGKRRNLSAMHCAETQAACSSPPTWVRGCCAAAPPAKPAGSPCCLWLNRAWAHSMAAHTPVGQPRAHLSLFRFMRRCGDAPDRRAGVGGQRIHGGRHPR